MKPETIALWRAIQARLDITVDGDPGQQTATAVAKAIGIRPEIVQPSPEFADNPASKTGAIDDRSERNIQSLIPAVREEFRKLLIIAKQRASGYGCDVQAISGNRTYEEQTALYNQGRTTPGNRVTNAKAGFSNHNFGIALDLGIFAGGKYLDSADPAKALLVHKAIAQAAKLNGLKLDWGGDWTSFKDIPHWEYRTGLSMAQKRARVAAGKPLV